jgi:tetratricopeptide (TPR) repeat protein
VKNNALYIVKIVLFVVLIFLVDACKTTKNTVMHRGWHNMNARYNGFYYSRENMKETVKRLEKVNKDDYSKPIPLFVYPDNTSAKSYYGDFDKTIKKSSTVIQRHAIVNKRTKEEIPNACKWIDENYVLIGKAHLYKRDFFSALEAFEYVSKKYPNPEAKYSGMLWMVRTNNEIGSLSSSELIVDELRNAKDFPTDRIYAKELALVTADFHIKRADYSPAIKSLTKGITLTKKKKEKARYIYVLAQLYELTGDKAKASQYYSMVPGLHPSYDMVFNAQMKRASLIDVNSADIKVVKKQLQRMLKDIKNVEFKDQIYYALAEIAYKENDVPLSMTYLNSSIQTSVSNNTQKALSYLKRADIYFDKLDYKRAQSNYDSTITFLPKDYPDYALIDAKKKSLTSLVVNLNTITLEDSLQRMAKMSEKDRNDVIDKMIAKIEEEEKRKEEERQNQLNELQNQNLNPTTTVVNNTPASNTWYFYNQTTVSFGIGEFTKKWGQRKLEDNWRRSEKDQILVVNTDEDTADEQLVDSDTTNDGKGSKEKSKKNKKGRDYYLKNIPLTAEALDKSTGKIIEAYYAAGTIYKEQLLNNKKSIETFEELTQRYPQNKYQLSSYYQLYRTYLLMDNPVKAEYYKNLILTNYADTEFAKIIKNPDYAKDIAASKSQVEKFYTETYELYADAKYSEALANCMKADSSFAKSTLMPQFAFIKALCIGRTQDISAFESALVQVTIKYPKEPVKEKAQQMLEMIKKQKNPDYLSAADSAAAKAPKFIFKEDGEYYWVAIVDNGKGDINKFKVAISDVNGQTYSIQQLAVSSVFLDATHQIVSVKTFAGKAKAMDYYNFMKGNQFVYSDLEAGTYQTFIISSENYSIFYKDKNINEYKQFFTQNFK